MNSKESAVRRELERGLSERGLSSPRFTSSLLTPYYLLFLLCFFFAFPSNSDAQLTPRAFIVPIPGVPIAWESLPASPRPGDGFVVHDANDGCDGGGGALRVFVVWSGEDEEWQCYGGSGGASVNPEIFFASRNESNPLLVFDSNPDNAVALFVDSLGVVHISAKCGGVIGACDNLPLLGAGKRAGHRDRNGDLLSFHTENEDGFFGTVRERAENPGDNPEETYWHWFFKSDGLYVMDDDGTVTGPLGTGGGGDDLGEATASDIVALFASGSCSGYLKSDGSCDTPAGGATIESLHTFRPQQNEPPVSNFARVFLRNNHPHLIFEDSPDQSAVFSEVLDRGYAGNGLTVTVLFSCVANSGNVEWQGAFEALASQDIDSDSFASAKSAVGVCNGTSGRLTFTDIAFSNSEIDGLVAGGPFRFRLTRNTSTSGDATGNAEVRMIEIWQ